MTKPYIIHALMLAAGESKRFHSSKQLALIDDKPMVIHTSLILQQTNCDATCVILGAKSEKIEPLFDKNNVFSHLLDTVSCITVDNWHCGMGASIASGIKSITDEVTHVLIGLADQIQIKPCQYNEMMALSVSQPSKIIAASYLNQLGAPVIFPRSYFQQLGQLSSEQGAKYILQANNDNVVAMELPEAARDIDTELDLYNYISHKYKGTNND